MKFLKYFPAIFIALIIVGLLGFYQYYLKIFSQHIVDNFSKQNFKELSIGDSYELSRRMNTLSSSVNWACLIGKRNNKVFYRRVQSQENCQKDFFSEVYLLRDPHFKGVEILFKIKLPKELELAVLVLLGFLLFLFLIVAYTIKRSEKDRYKKDLEIAQMSQQVAHDIRSPLSALNVFTDELGELPEEKRILIRSSVRRITDIVNDLSQKHASKNSIKKAETNKETISNQLLSSIIESMASEKRIQFRDKDQVKIEANLGQDTYGIFSKIQPHQFKRVLSNLINNAVEALDDGGEVTISLTLNQNEIALEVKDNGKGIPPHILPKLMKKGASFEKSAGSGLGLYHAKKNIELWGGSIHINSKLGKGTNVLIRLPATKRPEWFVPVLEINPQEVVVVLDDDQSIHHVWRNRLAKYNVPQNRIFCFTTPEKTIQWFNDNKSSKDFIFLCDYELLGHKTTGIDIIKQLNISKHTILVTSRFEDQDIINACQELKLKLLPKNLAWHLPILNHDSTEPTQPPQTIEPAHKDQFYDAVLIDDDDLVRTMWKISYKQNNKKLALFESPNDFFNNADDIALNTPIYIDSNLGDDVKGENVAKDIHKKGYQTIYLATGYQKDSFGEMPWITGIVGKEPPST